MRSGLFGFIVTYHRSVRRKRVVSGSAWAALFHLWRWWRGFFHKNSSLVHGTMNFLEMRVFEYSTKARGNQIIDQIFKSSNLQIFKSSNLQIFKSSNPQIFKSSNPQIKINPQCTQPKT